MEISPHAIQNFVAAAGYSLFGMIIFAAAFVIADKLTPGELWKEVIEDKNQAVAILFGCCAIALGIIIAAAISG